MKCLLCSRDCAPSSDLCRYHAAARKNVESGYSIWKEAYGEITWKEYLRKVRANRETGAWAKEVAALLARQAQG